MEVTGQGMEGPRHDCGGAVLAGTVSEEELDARGVEAVVKVVVLLLPMTVVAVLVMAA